MRNPKFRSRAVCFWIFWHGS